MKNNKNNKILNNNRINKNSNMGKNHNNTNKVTNNNKNRNKNNNKNNNNNNKNISKNNMVKYAKGRGMHIRSDPQKIVVYLLIVLCFEQNSKESQFVIL